MLKATSEKELLLFYFLFHLFGDAHAHPAALLLDGSSQEVRGDRFHRDCGAHRRVSGRDDQGGPSTHASTRTPRRQMSGRRVGFCLSDKKRRRMNLDAFADLCA